MSNTRQAKKDAQSVENNIVIPVQTYIDTKIGELMDFMVEFREGTLEWRTDIERKIIELVDLKRDIEQLKIDNTQNKIETKEVREGLSVLQSQLNSTITYLKWTYKIIAFLGGAIVGILAFYDKIRILFFK